MRWLDHLPRGSVGSSAVSLSLAEANAYQASLGNPTGTAARRADLIADLRERLPRTALADEVIETIASGTCGG
jgi:hypothetical protein